MGQFRSYVWDPVLIISQIIAVQTFYYIALGLLLAAFDVLFAGSLSIAQLFDYRELGYNLGFLIAISFLLCTSAAAFALFVFVGRAKQCLDFAATLHFIHFIACCWFAGLPGISWWILNIVCCVVTAVLGEYICMRYEISAIPIIGAQLS